MAEAVVGVDGRVHDPRAVSGSMVLRSAAQEAIRNRTYVPARLPGRPAAAPVADVAPSVQIRISRPTPSLDRGDDQLFSADHAFHLRLNRLSRTNCVGPFLVIPELFLHALVPDRV